MSLLHLENVSKTYPRATRPALLPTRLAMSSGELLALVGESGSGKTTLLRLIAGLETADAGQITLDGKKLMDGAKQVDAEKRGVGLVFQDHALFPHLTVEKNISFGLRRLPKGEQVRLVAELLELVGLPGYGARYPHELSGGERQRIALARALAPAPRLLLLDEPFSNLDSQWRVGIRDETRRILKQRGTTALLVTHHTQDALSVADRIVVLHRGEVQQVGTPREIYHAPANRYVATLFGICNFIPLPRLVRTCGRQVDCCIRPKGAAQETSLWARPEDLELARVPVIDVPDDLLRGEIRHVSFQGDHHDVILLCRDPQGTSFEVRVQHRGPERVVPGEVWVVQPRPRHADGAVGTLG